MSGTVVRYEPRGAARALFGNRNSEVVMAGAAGTGKSLACLFRVHLAALSTPGIRCLIARKTGVSLGSTTLVSFEKKVAAAALAAGVVTWFGGSAREAPSYRYSNGSTINVGGLDKPEKVLSSEYDLIFVDEATEITITDWETLGTRLRNGILSWQQQIAACNPVHPTHWIKQRANAGQLALLTSLHRDNPAYVNADGTLTRAGTDYMAKLDALTGVRRLRLRDGIWAAAEGLVYEEFNPALHVVSQSVVKPEWTRWWTVDFGYTNPFVWQEWAEDPDGRLYLYREIYRTKRLVEDHARDMLLAVTRVVGTVPERSVLTANDIRDDITRGLREWTEPKPRAVICDHDAEDRATLERHLGMGTSPARKTVKDGLQAGQARFKTAGDGKPRIYLCRDTLVERDEELAEAKKPTCTAEEAVGYVWEPPKPGGQPKEQPVKADDHGMDAMRYMVAERDLGSRPRLRRL
ncbi:phage terminase large subunit [Kitasatospora cineracea]|uniref:phage terminase large subunit n=1 Tax=Kitasatospora cineracea TaxID=88074 RepID=UPI0036BBD643